jgi:hypothetical protein
MTSSSSENWERNHLVRLLAFFQGEAHETTLNIERGGWNGNSLAIMHSHLGRTLYRIEQVEAKLRRLDERN